MRADCIAHEISRLLRIRAKLAHQPINRQGPNTDTPCPLSTCITVLMSGCRRTSFPLLRWVAHAGSRQPRRPLRLAGPKFRTTHVYTHGTALDCGQRPEHRGSSQPNPRANLTDSPQLTDRSHLSAQTAGDRRRKLLARAQHLPCLPLTASVFRASIRTRFPCEPTL